jgi:hypothetical protein
MIKVVPMGSIIIALPEPTMFGPQPALVIIFPRFLFIDLKYFVSLKMVLVVPLSARYV